MNKNHEWIRTHFEELVEKYAGHYVAVLNAKVVAVDKSGVRVREECKKRFPKERPSVIRVPREEDFKCLL